jgi:Actin
VVDGILLKQSQRRSGRGGDWLGNVQWKALLQNNNNNNNNRTGGGGALRPRYQLKPGFSTTASTTTASTNHSSSGGRGLFHRWAMQDLMYEFRSSQHVRVPEWRPTNTVPFIFSKEEMANAAAAASDAAQGCGGGDGDNDDKMDVDCPAIIGTTTTSGALTATPSTMTPPSTTTPKETSTYELPDGTLIDLTTPVGRDLCRIPELLFTDDLPFLSLCNGVLDDSILNQHDTLSNLPLHQLIRASLSAVGDVDVRKDLASSILLCGASSLLPPHFEARLSWQVSQIISTAFKPKVLASRQAVERSCASWIGGSILTSLGSFQQLWLGRSEYEEYGATLAIQRFP